MSTPGLVLFDCDGTLVDSDAFILRAAVDAFRAEGADDVLEKHRHRLIGLTFEAFLKAVSADLETARMKRVEDAFWHLIRTGRQNALETGVPVEPLFPGMADALHQLEEAGYLLGIVTNKGGSGLDSVLRTNGVTSRFVTLHHSHNSPPKPAPDMVLNALAATGGEKERCIVVGDTPNDTHLARNAGVRILGVRWSHSHQLGEGEGLDAVVDRVADLVGAVRRLIP